MIKESRGQDPQKIKHTIIQLKSRLLEYRFKAAQGDFATTHLIRECRKTIAKLFTVLKEKNEKLTNKDWKEFMNIYKEEHAKQVLENKEVKEKMAKETEIDELAIAEESVSAASSDEKKTKVKKPSTKNKENK